MTPRNPISKGQQRPRVRAHRRGQAMVEYSLITWALVVALVLAGTVRVIPGPKDDPGMKKNLIETFLEAYQTYYDSFYFVLNLPVP